MPTTRIVVLANIQRIGIETDAAWTGFIVPRCILHHQIVQFALSPVLGIARRPQFVLLKVRSKHTQPNSVGAQPAPATQVQLRFRAASAQVSS